MSNSSSWLSGLSRTDSALSRLACQLNDVKLFKGDSTTKEFPKDPVPSEASTRSPSLCKLLTPKSSNPSNPSSASSSPKTGAQGNSVMGEFDDPKIFEGNGKNMGRMVPSCAPCLQER